MNPSTHSSRTPKDRAPILSIPNQPMQTKTKTISHGLLSIPLTGLHSTDTTPDKVFPSPTKSIDEAADHVSPPSGFNKLSGNALTPNQKAVYGQQEVTESSKAQEPNNVGLLGPYLANPKHPEVSSSKELFDKAFLQKFYFSPALSLHQPSSSNSAGFRKLPYIFIDEPLIPLEQLIQMVLPLELLNMIPILTQKEGMVISPPSLDTPNSKSSLLPTPFKSLSKARRHYSGNGLSPLLMTTLIRPRRPNWN